MSINSLFASAIVALMSGAATTAPGPATPVERGFIAICLDKEGAANERRALLQPHLDYIDTIKEKVLIGGPSQDPATNTPHGSIIIYRAASLDEARDLLARDPLSYVFASCHWDKFSQYVGVYVNGWAGGYSRR